MKIFISKKQFKPLISALAIGKRIYWLLSDKVDEKYQKKYLEVKESLHSVLWYYKDFGVDEEDIEEFENKVSFSSKYMYKIADIMYEYNEMEFWEVLANKLANREMEEIYWEERLKEMSGDEYGRIEIFKRDKYEKDEEIDIDNLSLKF